jgi:pseudolysin/vibriolysin
VPAGATGLEEVRAVETTARPVTGALAEAVRGYALASPALTGPRDDWQVRSAGEGRDGLHHVRLAQRHDGIRVWGSEVAVHASAAGIRSVTGNRMAHLDGFDVTPAIDAKAALAAAKAEHARRGDPAAPTAYTRQDSELVIYPQVTGDARLAWRVELFTEPSGGLPGQWNYFVDAKTGAVLSRFDALATVVQASGAGGNARFGRFWDQQLDVVPVGGQFAMKTPRMQTLDLAHATSGGTVVLGPLFFFQDLAASDAHGFAEQTLDMLSGWLGYNSIDDHGLAIKSRVHYGTGIESSFWDGMQVTYGDGGTNVFALSGAIDIVGHEISHGFTSFHANLIPAGQSGAIGESFADIGGTLAEFFVKGDAADFDIGRDVMSFNATRAALRFMCTPTADGVSIDHLSNYNDAMDIHAASGIMNKAFCRAVRRLAPGTTTTVAARRAGTAWFAANAGYWTASTTFTQGCQGVLDAATALGYTTAERNALRDAWKDVGVFCDGAVAPVNCNETFTTSNGEITSPQFPSAYPNGTTRTYCIRPDDGEPVTLLFTDFATEEGFDVVTIRDGAGAILQTASGTTGPVAITAPMLSVTFTSDESVNAPGWRAIWSNPPTVAITAPGDGARVEAAVAIATTASDLDGVIAQVEFALPDGTTRVATQAPFQIVWASTTVANGRYAITAHAVDNDGVTGPGAVVTVDVENPACLDPTIVATSGITSGTTTGGPDAYDPSCASFTGSGPDTSVQLDLPALNSLDLTLTASYNAVFELTSGSCHGSVLSCQHGTNQHLGPLAAGAYYVVVDGFSTTDSGAFTLNVTGEIAAGGSCEAPLATSGALVCATGTTCSGEPGARTCRVPACSDGVDNDGDGRADYPNDPGCDSPEDDDEADACPGPDCPVCANGLDDDGDGSTDFALDSSCWAASGTDEAFCSAHGERDRALQISRPRMTGSTVGLHSDFGTACVAAPGPDVAFSLKLPVPVAQLVIETFDSSPITFDTVLSLRDAQCSSELACDDDFNNTQRSFLRLTDLPAGDYAVVLAGFNGNSFGTYSLHTRGTVVDGTPCTAPLFASGVLGCTPPAACRAGTCQ